MRELEIGGLRFDMPATARFRQASMPMRVMPERFGRCEIALGRPGEGKSTWAARRAVQLAKARGVEVVTTSDGPLTGWRQVTSMGQFLNLRNCVLHLDEVHYVSPGTTVAALGTKEQAAAVAYFMTELRKFEVCVVATTQSWNRVSTVLRSVSTMVWGCKAFRTVGGGQWLAASPHETPPDGGKRLGAIQWHRPDWTTEIDTNASAWFPGRQVML